MDAAQLSEYRAGVARRDITPPAPIWMSGYEHREYPAEGAEHPLWAKALAIEDRDRTRIVIVTADLIAIPREISEFVAEHAQRGYGLGRPQIVFNASHTHTGPVVWPNLQTMFDLGRREGKVLEYGRRLREDLLGVIGAALEDLRAARLSYGFGQIDFAVNRRERTQKGTRIGVNPMGPVDRDVPVLAIRTETGRLRAVVFGYACHNATLTGKFCRLSGDYAGFAQIELEKRHTGAIALFLALCGGNQNPYPSGSLKLARRHGGALAEEVERVLETALFPLDSPLRSAFLNTDLNFALHTRDMFRDELKEANAAVRRRANAMLRAYDEGRPISKTAYPIQVIRFGSTLTLLMLGGEVVVEYSLLLKQMYGRNVVVAAYSNDVMSYIPTQRMLREGGYEVVDSMIYYGQPGPFAHDVQNRVLEGVERAMAAVGLKPNGETTSAPLVTVVIPVFNREATIEAALASVQAQTFSGWEAIVVDDGSVDSTQEKIIHFTRKDSRITLKSHARRRGAQAARNTGIDAARTKWVAFLDSDDLWLPNSLELRLRAANDYAMEVVHSGAYMIDEDGKRSVYELPALHGWIYRDILRGPGPMFQGLLVSADALRRIGGLDERVVAMQEWDTAIRLSKHYEFAYVPVPTYIWDCRCQNTITKDALRDAKGYEQVVHKHFSSILRHAGLAAISVHFGTLARRYYRAGAKTAAYRNFFYSLLWPANWRPAPDRPLIPVAARHEKNRLFELLVSRFPH